MIVLDVVDVEVVLRTSTEVFQYERMCRVLKARCHVDWWDTDKQKEISMRIDWDNDLLFRLTNRSRFEVIVRSRVSLEFSLSSAGDESIPCPASALTPVLDLRPNWRSSPHG